MCAHLYAILPQIKDNYTKQIVSTTLKKLSRYEQEMVVNYNAREQTATVYPRDKTVMKILDMLVADFLYIYKLIE